MMMMMLLLLQRHRLQEPCWPLCPRTVLVSLSTVRVGRVASLHSVRRTRWCCLFRRARAAAAAAAELHGVWRALKENSEARSSIVFGALRGIHAEKKQLQQQRRKKTTQKKREQDESRMEKEEEEERRRWVLERMTQKRKKTTKVY